MFKKFRYWVEYKDASGWYGYGLTYDDPIAAKQQIDKDKRKGEYRICMEPLPEKIVVYQERK